MKVTFKKVFSNNWVILALIFILLLVLYLHKTYLLDFIEYIVIFLSILPGIIIALLVSLITAKSQIRKSYQWVINISSLILPMVITYYYWGKRISECLEKTESGFFLTMLITIFIAAFWLTVKPVNKT